MVSNRSVTVQIKGVKDGLLITTGMGEWSDLQIAIIDLIHERETFFRGARVAVDVGNNSLQIPDIVFLKEQLKKSDITLWAIITNSSTTELAAQNLGLDTRLSTFKSGNRIKSQDPSLSGEEAILINRTLRSGFQIHHEGHVVVIGDVNPGAVIIAHGSVVIWGKLNGIVHAGAKGDESSVVCALDLNPNNMRIAECESTNLNHRRKKQPELIRIKDGKLISEVWNKKIFGVK